MYDMLHAGDRVAMDWDTYESLGPEVRGEYVEGALILSPSPTQRHQRIIRNLVMAIAEVVPAGIDVLSEWAWKPAEDEFVPDVVVFDQTDEEPRLTGVPYLAVEVLSSDPARDSIRKFHKYAAAGLQHYWIIDPDLPTVIVYALDDGAYVETARHTAGTKATLDIGVLELSLDPGDLIR